MEHDEELGRVITTTTQPVFGYCRLGLTRGRRQLTDGRGVWKRNVMKGPRYGFFELESPYPPTLGVIEGWTVTSVGVDGFRSLTVRLLGVAGTPADFDPRLDVPVFDTRDELVAALGWLVQGSADRFAAASQSA